MASGGLSYFHLSSLTLVRQNRAALSVGIVSDMRDDNVGSYPYSLPERICERPFLFACAKHFSRRKLHHLRHAKVRELRNPSVIGVDAIIEKLAAIGDSLL